MSEGPRLVLTVEPGPQTEAGATLKAQAQLHGAKAQELTLRLERTLYSASVAKSPLVIDKRTLPLNPQGRCAAQEFQLPDDAFGFEGTEVSVRWSLVAELRLVLEGVTLTDTCALTVFPPVRHSDSLHASAAMLQAQILADRSSALLAWLGYALLTLVFALACGVMALPGGSTAAAPVRAFIALGALAWVGVMMFFHLWPKGVALLRAVRAPPLMQSALRCGEAVRFAVPADDRRAWQLVRVESRHFTRTRRSTTSGATIKRKVLKEHLTVLASGEGAGSPEIPLAGPPSFTEAGLRVRYELRFHRPGAPEPYWPAPVLVLPGRVG